MKKNIYLKYEAIFKGTKADCNRIPKVKTGVFDKFICNSCLHVSKLANNKRHERYWSICGKSNTCKGWRSSIFLFDVYRVILYAGLSCYSKLFNRKKEKEGKRKEIAQFYAAREAA